MSSESQSQTALASLHATYTDSEEEAEGSEEENTQDKILSPHIESSHSSMDELSKENKQHSKLVSYATEAHDDEDMSDSDNSITSSDFQDDSSEHRVVPVGIPPLSPVSFHRSLMNLKKEEIKLPPDPVGKCSKSLQEKIGELYQKKKTGNRDMNASIQKRKDFRNPSIYEKLIQFCNIDEQGTNYPPESYDPHCWGPESFYEELAKRQKEEMDKREKEKKDRTKVEFISGTVKRPSDSSTDAAKRKSKWDVGVSQIPASALKPAQLITPSVLQVPTGTKPTVISAFGTISKKSKN